LNNLLFTVFVFINTSSFCFDNIAQCFLQAPVVLCVNTPTRQQNTFACSAACHWQEILESESAV